MGGIVELSNGTSMDIMNLKKGVHYYFSIKTKRFQK